MYLEHYQLNKKPFSLTPGPDFFWLSEKHKEALATLRYGVIGDLGFLLLTGEVGVGKTALIHRLLSSLDSSTIVAHITDPGLGVNDFFRLLANEFGIDTPFKSKGEFLIILERFLRQADKDQKKVLLIVDEAQRVNNVLLDQIRVLSNIELNDRKLINIFFIGQPEFKKILLASINRPIRQRIAIYYHVQPLTEAETGQYIAHRLKIAGAEQKIFKPDAISEIYRISQGFPRAINILCDHALLTGYASGKRTIGSSAIKECENELNIEDDIGFPPPTPTLPPKVGASSPESASDSVPSSAPARQSKAWAYPVVIAAGIVMVALAGYYFLWTGPSGTQPNQVPSGPIKYQLSDAPTNENAPPPALPESDTRVAMNDSSKQNSSASNRVKIEVEPLAEAAETIPELAIPTPPPEITMATAEKAPVEPPTPADDKSPTNGLVSSDRTASPTLIAAADGHETISGEQTLTNAEPVSPGGMSTPPPATMEPEVTQNNEALPADQPAEPSVEQQESPKSQQPLAKLDPAISQAEGVVVDRPPAAAEQKAAAEAQQPEGQPRTRVNDSSENIADTTPPPVPAAAPVAGLAAEAPSPPAISSPPITNTGASTDKPAAASPPTSTPVPAARQEIGDLAPATPGTSPEKDLSATPAEPDEPAIPATAALQPQDTESGPAIVDQTEMDEAMESRVRSFLQDYCNTYAAKDLDSFKDFFASNAMENGKSFQSLLPKYQKNFTFIDTIYYRIELQQVTHEDDGEMLKVDGTFFLRWLPPDKKWRENAGKINMTLENSGSSFLVHRLDYQSNRSKQN